MLSMTMTKVVVAYPTAVADNAKQSAERAWGSDGGSRLGTTHLMPGSPSGFDQAFDETCGAWLVTAIGVP